ncbi:MAG: iron chelate uptake ABC transporter family permease subunit, partial [Phocaeicola sp.]|nr:iron chelate uptake ABC transporter family permease subunit [Phocaeicola sp.]
MMKRSIPLMLALLAIIAAMFIINLVLGSVEIPVKDVWNILIGKGSESEVWQNIIIKSRLPQALTALVGGAGLAVSVLQMQSVFRNPL